MLDVHERSGVLTAPQSFPGAGIWALSAQSAAERGNCRAPTRAYSPFIQYVASCSVARDLEGLLFRMRHFALRWTGPKILHS